MFAQQIRHRVIKHSPRRDQGRRATIAPDIDLGLVGEEQCRHAGSPRRFK
jgi:hypothetical protein